MQNDCALITEHLVVCLETHKVLGRSQKLLACKMVKDSETRIPTSTEIVVAKVKSQNLSYCKSSVCILCCSPKNMKLTLPFTCKWALASRPDITFLAQTRATFLCGAVDARHASEVATISGGFFVLEFLVEGQVHP